MSLQVIVLILVAGQCFAGPREDQIKKEYADHVAAIQAFYSSLKVEATESFANNIGEEPQHVDVTFWAADGNLATEYLYQSDYPDNPQWTTGNRNYFVATPKCSFKITTNSDKHLVVDDLRRDEAGYKKMQQMISNRARFATVPYSIFGEKIIDLLSNKAVSITGVEESSDSIKILWSEKVPEMDRRGFYRFQRATWVLTGYEIAMQDAGTKYPIPSKLCGEVEYVDGGMECPLVKRVNLWTEKAQDAGAKSQTYSFDVTNVSLASADDKVFDLFNYDLSVRDQKMPPVLYLMVDGLVVLIALAIGLRYLANRATL